MPGPRLGLQLKAIGPAPLRPRVAPPHRLHEGVTSFGIGYGTFILAHTPARGFLDAEVQGTRNPSDAAVRRWSPSTAWKRLASKRLECVQLAGAVVMHKRFESGSKLRALQTLRAIRLRTGMSALRNQCGGPEGTHDNSPALQCWGKGASRKHLSPGGTAEAWASRMRLAPRQPSLRDSADPS